MKNKLESGWYESGEFLWRVEAGRVVDAICAETGVQHSCAERCFMDEIEEANEQLGGCMALNQFEPVDDDRVEEVCGG